MKFAQPCFGVRSRAYCVVCTDTGCAGWLFLGAWRRPRLDYDVAVFLPTLDSPTRRPRVNCSQGEHGFNVHLRNSACVPIHASLRLDSSFANESASHGGFCEVLRSLEEANFLRSAVTSDPLRLHTCSLCRPLGLKCHKVYLLSAEMSTSWVSLLITGNC